MELAFAKGKLHCFRSAEIELRFNEYKMGLSWEGNINGVPTTNKN